MEINATIPEVRVTYHGGALTLKVFRVKEGKESKLGELSIRTGTIKWTSAYARKGGKKIVTEVDWETFIRYFEGKLFSK